MTDQRCGPPESEVPAPQGNRHPRPATVDIPDDTASGSKRIFTRRATPKSASRGAHRLGGFAAGLAGADLPVLPLLPRTKRPRFKGSYRRATCDLQWIDWHWWHHPEDNIGVRPPLGMVVLDVDPRNGGDEQMRKLVAEHGPLPDTWTARTGSGGSHLWFVVGEMTPRAHLCAGVDVKTGATGFVVAPPSVHPDGGVYGWLTPPVDNPAMAPDWLRALLAPPVYDFPAADAPSGGHGVYSAQCLVRRIEMAPEGMRNTTVYGACRDAAKQGDLDVSEDALVAAAVATGLSPAEVAGIVRSARRGGS